MGERLQRQFVRGCGRRADARAGMPPERNRRGCLRWTLLATLLVVTLGVGSTSFAQAMAADASLPSATARRQLQLDHGQRWPADSALREGMRRIRAIALWMRQAQAEGTLSARQSRAATASIEDSVAAIVDHPPRGEGMDTNLRLLLGRVLAADELPQLLDALDLYPRYFADPDWQPVTADAPPDHGPPDNARESTPAAQP